ncbi:CLUMA_CG013392, isoform A [Clunio marinus]|uniref:CLUMA_CG013392, isoform A n=1 Tax=Clunio marinus TaxID=568069 RepID=A0A1J1IIP0_9DIPT|nr:CLUMA_CG013392, isoform A [Clunio marinus]
MFIKLMISWLPKVLNHIISKFTTILIKQVLYPTFTVINYLLKQMDMKAIKKRSKGNPREKNMAQVQRRIVHKQFNSPIALYSDTNVKETLNRELKLLDNGAVGTMELTKWGSFV